MGNRRLEVAPFLKGENESLYFTWQPIYVESKWVFVRMSKQKRNERNYLYLTVEFRSRTKRYTIQFVFRWIDFYSAAVDMQCSRDNAKNCHHFFGYYVLVTQVFTTVHHIKITHRIIECLSSVTVHGWNFRALWKSRKCSLTFWHRSFTFNSNKSPTWRKNFSVYYPDVCLQLNMFRELFCPSSEAQWLQWQPLVLPSYRGDSRAVFVVGPAGWQAGRPDHEHSTAVTTIRK
jgi:hypothetical protein